MAGSLPCMFGDGRIRDVDEANVPKAHQEGLLPEPLKFNSVRNGRPFAQVSQARPEVGQLKRVVGLLMGTRREFEHHPRRNMEDADLRLARPPVTGRAYFCVLGACEGIRLTG